MNIYANQFKVILENKLNKYVTNSCIFKIHRIQNHLRKELNLNVFFN
jgi:hypothetical protein